MNTFDAVIVGGGTAGLSAALLLGRSRRQVLVCDSGEYRNAPSHEAHSFFSRDGINPVELLRIGRVQLAAYNSVGFRRERVTGITGHNGQFELTLQDGVSLFSRKILLATGMVDELPPIEGFEEMWGISVLHCPYCHGWEVSDKPIALYGNGQTGFELCSLIKGWSSDLVLCTDGPANLTDEQRQLLLKHGIPLREERIARLVNGHLKLYKFGQ